MRAWLLAIGIALAIAGNAPRLAHATASAGNSGMTAYLSLTGVGGSSLRGLAVTAVPTQQSTFVQAEGNATATAGLGGFGYSFFSDSKLTLTARSNLAVTASPTGHALAEVIQSFDVQILNSTTENIIFNAITAYSLDTYVFVEDKTRESLVTTFNIGVRFDDLPGGNIGDGRTIVCNAETTDSYACRNHYDLSDNIFGYGLVLAPGETIDLEMRSGGRFEATAVPEPSTLVLVLAAGLGFFSMRLRAAQ